MSVTELCMCKPYSCRHLFSMAFDVMLLHSDPLQDQGDPKDLRCDSILPPPQLPPYSHSDDILLSVTGLGVEPCLSDLLGLHSR